MIPLLTDENYMVWDPFAGSGVTAQVAKQLGWRWIINERSLTYLQVRHYAQYLPQFPVIKADLMLQ